jgi:hypothetical protein
MNQVRNNPKNKLIKIKIIIQLIVIQACNWPQLMIPFMINILWQTK